MIRGQRGLPQNIEIKFTYLCTHKVFNFFFNFRCDSMSTCTVTSSTATLAGGTDPCQGTTKYAEITYKCV